MTAKYFVTQDIYGGEISVVKAEEVIARNVEAYVAMLGFDNIFVVLAQADNEVDAERFKKLFLESHAA